MKDALQKLKQWASEAGHAVDGEVHKFLAWAEGKSRLDEAAEELRAAGYTVTPPSQQ